MKKGFTLIELLAVIVILAIIALIATPIILGIINDARKESNERSVELYASAVRNAIAAYQLTGTKAPESFDDLDIQYDGNVECATEELYEDGSFYIADCTVNGVVVEYTYGTKQDSPVEPGKMSSVCKPVSIATTGTYTAGDKYECKVDPNKDPYTFYVLTTATEDATTVNMIMDSNINISGQAVKTGVTDLGLLEWIIDTYYLEVGGNEADHINGNNMNIYGPITAMNYLQTATQNWINVNSQTVSRFTECNNSGVCTNKQMAKTYTTYARLPYKSEVSSSNGTNEYLYENLDSSLWEGVGAKPTNNVSGIGGYWTLSSDSSSSLLAWHVYNEGFVFSAIAATSGNYGVRPVITVPVNRITQ